MTGKTPNLAKPEPNRIPPVRHSRAGGNPVDKTPYKGSSDIRVGHSSGIEVQSPTMKVHGSLEMLRAAEPASSFLYRGDLGIHSLGHGIGNAMRKVRHHIRQMPIDQLGRGNHGFQVAVGSPEVPALPELPGAGFGALED